MRTTSLAGVCLSSLALLIAVGSTAAAGDESPDHARGGATRSERRERARERRDGGADERMDHERHHGATAGGTDDDSEADEADDGGAPVHVARSPAQAEFHTHLVSGEREKLRRWAHERKRHLTPQERQAMGVHWRHVMRLERIRELAEQDNDTAVAKKADELLERENKKFEAKLAQFGAGDKSDSAMSSDGGAR